MILFILYGINFFLAFYFVICYEKDITTDVILFIC